MGNRRLLFLLAALGVNYLLFQSILVPYAMVEKVNIPIIEEHEGMHSYGKSSLAFDSVSKLGGYRNDIHNVGKNNSLEFNNVGSNKTFIAVLAKESKKDSPVKQFLEAKRGISTISLLEKSKNVDSMEHDRVDFGTSQRITSPTNSTHLEKSTQKIKLFASDKRTVANVTVRKMRCNMPPKSRMLIQEMNHLLERRRVSSRAMVLLSLSIMNLLVANWISYCCGLLIISIWISTFDCRNQGGHPNLIRKFLLQGRRLSMLLQ
jgi:hypothetical protein